jgi:peptidyl-prolyl cis-trans isomerase C
MRGNAAIRASLAGLALFTALAPGASAQSAGKAAAVVNGVTIPVSDVDAVLKERPTPVQLTESQLKQSRQAALTALVDDQLYRQFLQKYGPKVDPAELARRQAKLEADLKMGGRTLADLAKETGKSEAQMRENAALFLRQGMQEEAWINGRVTDADLKHYYDENKDLFDGVSVRASHIVKRTGPKATEADRQAARTKLLAVRQQIISKQITFADAAKNHSEDSLAASGGDIGFFPRKGVVDEAFARAAYALQPGQVSDVVETDYGLHLIQVTERKAGTPSDYEKLKDLVRQYCGSEMLQKAVEQFRKASKIEMYMQ